MRFLPIKTADSHAECAWRQDM